MPRAKKQKPIDDLVAELFGGAPPAVWDAETVREAHARQLVQCHALIREEINEVLDPVDDELSDMMSDRQRAYHRIDGLAKTIGMFDAMLRPAQGEQPDVKRHALTIEVQRRDPAALPAPADTPALTKPWPVPTRWPIEAFNDENGDFDNDLYEQAVGAGPVLLNRFRNQRGYPPFEGDPLPLFP